MKKVLMVAFHYPPYEGGSGVHRTLKFSRYLPDHGWQPIVLSAHPRAYTQLGEEQIQEIPCDVIVKRAFALDTARHLSIRGRYPKFLALPDRWANWWFAGVVAGLRLIRKHRPSCIWSTYPIATAHLIGLTLHKLTGLPWVADFRDSMTENSYPRDPWSRRSYLWIERRAVKYASCLVFTAPSTCKMYLQRYPNLPVDRCMLLPNGYDENDFKGLTVLPRRGNLNGRPIRLLHAGLIYTDDRDPTAFFNAVSRLKNEGLINSALLKMDLRASGSEAYYTELITQRGIADIVHLLPALSHRKALQDCAESDALLLFQAASCNHQVPAKVYEYLRLGKPILALTSYTGDTAALLEQTGGATVVDLADEKSIFPVLPQFLGRVRDGTHPFPDAEKVRRYTRTQQALDLVRRLNELTSNGGTRR